MSRDDPRQDASGDGPSANAGPFVALIAQVCAGSEAAARTLYEDHSKDVLEVIRGLLSPRDPLRRHVESIDVAQEAWRSAFEALKQGEAFADERDFVRFLHKVAANCVGMLRRAGDAEKRSISREEPMAGRELPAKTPGPDELAESTDEWRLFLADLCPRDRFIVAHVSDGYRLSEIARGMRLDVRLVQRVVQHAKFQWMEHQWAAESPGRGQPSPRPRVSGTGSSKPWQLQNAVGLDPERGGGGSGKT